MGTGNSTGLWVILILVLVLVVILAVITVSLSLRMSRLSRKYQIFMMGEDARSLEDQMLERFSALDKISSLSESNEVDLQYQKRVLNKTLTHYGIVKYDAFDDVGGKMSFALAMLDNEDSGFILNTVHSRDNCFLYLKEIVKGESYIMLSTEEIEALRIAANSVETDGILL